MEVLDELAVLAEIGIAFAGFLSIFLVFASRDGRFSPADGLAVLNVVASGFGVVFSAFVPIVLHRLGVEGELLWRLSGVIALCSSVPISFYLISRERNARAQQGAESMPAASRVVGLSIGLLNIAIFSALALGVLSSIAPGMYLFALVVALALGAWNFVSLALTRML